MLKAKKPSDNVSTLEENSTAAGTENWEQIEMLGDFQPNTQQQVSLMDQIQFTLMSVKQLINKHNRACWYRKTISNVDSCSFLFIQLEKHGMFLLVQE